MVRSIACLVVIALASLISACCPEDEFIPTAIIRDTLKAPAFLRVVHAAADLGRVRTILDSRNTDFILASGYFESSDFNKGKYYRADTATRLISFVANSVIASKAIKLEAGKYYTAYLHGRAPNYDILLTTDTVAPAPPFGQLKVRVVNLSPDSPPIDVKFSTSSQPLATSLSYGRAAEYSTRGGADLGSPGLVVVRSGSTDTLMEVLPNLLLIPDGVIMTLVISGETTPTGNAPLLSFAAGFESAYDPDDGLYGNGWLKINLTAIRLINLVPMDSWEGVDLAFYDAEFERKYPGFNDGYRRNFPGQIQVWEVASLTHPENNPKGYFLQSSDKPFWKYRVEWQTREYRDPSTQRPISLPDTLNTAANQRFTVVLFGDTATSVRTTEIHDNVAPPSPSMSRLQFFHGGVGTLEGKSLRLRAGVAETPMQSYGLTPTANMAIDAPSGTVTLDVVDDAGTVVHSSQHTLDAGKIYTVFLTPKADRSGYLLRPVTGDLRR